MKKVFLDCGTNLGQGLLQFVDKNIINSEFEIHCFEPNPYAMSFAKDRLTKECSGYSIIFNQVALWTENCKKNLTIESFDGDYVCQHTGKILGSNLKAGGATNIMGDAWSRPSYIPELNLIKDIEVECIDFSSYIDANISPSDYVICKMDIEGAEYEVLRKLIDDGTINKIDEIYIEWHNHLLTTNNNTQDFINEIRSRNIKIETWI